MKQLSAEAKHHILLEYTPHSSHGTFAALALRHEITGGKKVVRDWYERWDGTAASLLHRKGAGRPYILSKQLIARHIATPIRAANRSHRAIHYTQLMHSVSTKANKQLSLRTLQRYGKLILHAKNKHTTKRTEQECK